MDSRKLRILTYNIHKGIGGVDRRYRLERIVQVLQHYDADLVLLQEVDDGVPRSRRDVQAERLATELDYPHVVFQRNVKLKEGHYGNAILSRFPLHDTYDLDLTVSVKKRRRALIARARVSFGEHSRQLWLCNTHLGLAGFERTLQLKRLLADETLQRVHRVTPAIIGGDFNDVWNSIGRRRMYPAGFRCAVGPVNTFPAVLPVRSLDAIYYRGDLKYLSSFAGRIETCRQASDHLPVVADFEVLSPRNPGLASQESDS